MATTKKIEKLTPEQEKDLVAFREQWLAKGMNTEPADFPRAEAAITEFYTRLNMEKPEFIRVASPRAAAALDDVPMSPKRQAAALERTATQVAQHLKPVSQMVSAPQSHNAVSGSNLGGLSHGDTEDPH